MSEWMDGRTNITKTKKQPSYVREMLGCKIRWCHNILSMCTSQEKWIQTLNKEYFTIYRQDFYTHQVQVVSNIWRHRWQNHSVDRFMLAILYRMQTYLRQCHYSNLKAKFYSFSRNPLILYFMRKDQDELYEMLYRFIASTVLDNNQLINVWDVKHGFYNNWLISSRIAQKTCMIKSINSPQMFAKRYNGFHFPAFPLRWFSEKKKLWVIKLTRQL